VLRDQASCRWSSGVIAATPGVVQIKKKFLYRQRMGGVVAVRVVTGIDRQMSTNKGDSGSWTFGDVGARNLDVGGVIFCPGE
jgi:hypothetical protein